MNDGPELRLAEGSDRAEVEAMIDLLHQTTLFLRFDEQGEPDPNASGKLMCALVMFAGAICGEMIGRKRKVARVAAMEGLVQ